MPSHDSARFPGQVCLVTGAASGIGRSISRAFAAEGAVVFAVDVAAEAVAELAGEIGGLAGVADVADERAVQRLVAAGLEELGRIDVLVNNAGVSGVGDILETTPAQWDEVMRVNARGVFVTTRAVLPHMIDRKAGAIVNVSSAIAETGLARRVSYAASKGAVLALTRSLQVDCAPHGIRVNAVLPGTIMTSFVERYLGASYADPAQGMLALRKRQLTGELGAPEDVAAAVLFLASDDARFVLGTGLAVDGGLSATRV